MFWSSGIIFFLPILVAIGDASLRIWEDLLPEAAEPGLNQFWSCLRCFGVGELFLLWRLKLGRTSSGRYLATLWAREDFSLG